MTESLARLAACERENAELKSENARLRDQLCLFDPIFSIRQSLPSDSEAAALLRIVCGRYPHLKEKSPERECVENFLASLAYVHSLTVTKEPQTQFSGSWWCVEGSTWCSNARISGRVRTMLPAIIACGSIPFQLDHSALFLDPHRARGVSVDRASWKRVLAGGDLLAATPVKVAPDRSIGHVHEVARTW